MELNNCEEISPLDLCIYSIRKRDINEGGEGKGEWQRKGDAELRDWKAGRGIVRGDGRERTADKQLPIKVNKTPACSQYSESLLQALASTVSP